MYANCRIAMIIFFAHFVRLVCIFEVAGGYEQMRTPDISCALNNLLAIILMMLFAVVVSPELMVCEVGCNVVEFEAWAIVRLHESYLI